MSFYRFFRRRYWDEERARELDSYLAEAIDDNLARGMTPDEARAAAHRKLGNTTRIREEIYTMLFSLNLEDLPRSLLRRNQVFAVLLPRRARHRANAGSQLWAPAPAAEAGSRSADLAPRTDRIVHQPAPC